MSNIGQSETRLARRKRMVAEMSNMRTLKWVGVAFAVHIIVIVSTSVGTISDFLREKRLFGLSPVVAAPAVEPVKAQEPATQPTTAPAKPVAAADAGSDARTAGLSDDDKRLAESAKAGNPMAQKLTETAKPSERPKEPSHGFKISEDP